MNLKALLVPGAILALAGCAQGPGLRTTGAALEGGGYPVQTCNAAYAARAAACTLSGSGTRMVVRANLISGQRLYIGGQLLLDANGLVEAAGCDLPAAPDAVVLDCPGALVSPGLINLHEHIDYSYQQPPRPPVLKWQHRNEWRPLPAAERGFEGDAPKDPAVNAEVSERAMLRHALSGETAVSGAKNFRAFLRNLKLPDPPLATPFGKPVMDKTFPVNDGDPKKTLTAPCDAAQIAAVEFWPEQAYVPHVGEGTNAAAHYEVDCVLDAIAAKKTPSAFIHGVGITEPQVSRLKSQNVGVVLSPRSNFQLYGTTAPVMALKQSGVPLAIGTDWSPSGSLTLLDEARCLARYNRDALGQALSAADLHRMMTVEAARAVGLEGRLGTLAPGEFADMVVFDTEGRTDLREILERTALRQTVAVFVGGKVASAPADWQGRLPQLDNCSVDPRALCGASRLVCGANAQRPLGQLLQQAFYTIDDARICEPQATDDCVAVR